jgi:hypothetical protein
LIQDELPHGCKSHWCGNECILMCFAAGPQLIAGVCGLLASAKWGLTATTPAAAGDRSVGIDSANRI